MCYQSWKLNDSFVITVSSEVHLLREQLNEANKTLKEVQKEKQGIETKAAKLVCIVVFSGSTLCHSV